jgi:hypothetical protein
MAFWNKSDSSAVVEEEPLTEYTDEASEPEPEEDEISPYGDVAFGLTNFGDVWIDMLLVEGVAFDPPDGCAAEVYTKDTTYHLNDPDAAAFLKFLRENISITNK